MFRSSKRWGRVLLGAALLFAAAGCASHANLEYAEVKGKVTLEGVPLAGVLVTFYPDTEGTQGLPYTRATTDEAGMYELADAEGKPGAVVGKCRVVVAWPRERGSG